MPSIVIKRRSLESLWRFLEDEGIETLIFSEATSGPIRNEAPPADSRNNISCGGSSEPNASKKRVEDEGANAGHDKATKMKQAVQEGSKKQDHEQKQSESPATTNLLLVPKDWNIWQELVAWATKTNQIDSPSKSIAYQIAENLKLGRKVNPWLQKHMEHIWKTSIRKGFRSESYGKKES